MTLGSWSCRFYCLPYLILFAALILQISAPAQQYSANEITVGASMQTYTWRQGCLLDFEFSQCAYSISPSFALTLTHNLSSSVAIEGTYQPTSPYFMQNDLYDSGRETLASGGVKSGWRGRRWGLYGELQAGIASFSCATWYYVENANQQLTGWNRCSRLTHFAMEYGGVAEFRKSTRYSFRLDAGHLMVAEFDQNLSPRRMVDDYDLNARWGGIFSHFDMRLGVTRNFGQVESATSEHVPDKQKWDSGVTFAIQPRTEPYFTNGFVNSYPQWGVWASRNFSNHVSWDTTLLHSPRNPGKIDNVSYQAGGRAFEALSGIKFGFRKEHFGYFAKVRPGVITFGETYRQRDDIPCFARREPRRVCGSRIDQGMFTDAVLDTGGILEAYPTRHSILRFEAGSTTIFYLSKTIINSGYSEPIPETTGPAMLFGFGGGVRF